MANSERPLTPSVHENGGGGARPNPVDPPPPPASLPSSGPPLLAPLIDVIQDGEQLSLDAPVSTWYAVAIALSLGLADLNHNLPGQAGATQLLAAPVLYLIASTLHQRHPALRPNLERLTRDAGVQWTPAP